MNHVSFTSCRWLGVHELFTWGRDGTRMHYGKKVSWQRHCDALGSVLLGNLGSWHSCEYYFDTYHLPKHRHRTSTPLHGNSIP